MANTSLVTQTAQPRNFEPIDRQIDCLLDIWPKLRFHVFPELDEMKRRASAGQTPDLIAVVRWKAFGGDYAGLVVHELLPKLFELRSQEFPAEKTLYKLASPQVRRTKTALETIERKQCGDILIFPAQWGESYRNTPNALVRERLQESALGEFPLDIVAVISVLIANPDKLVSSTELILKCLGNEPERLSESEEQTPAFYYYEGLRVFPHYSRKGELEEDVGTPTGFLPRSEI